MGEWCCNCGNLARDWSVFAVMNKLKKAYKRLNLQEYKGIVDEANGVLYKMHVYDFEDDLICTLGRHSDFKIVKHRFNGKFYGYNVYTRVNQTLMLIDTKESKKQAWRLVMALKVALTKNQLEFILPY